MAFYVYILTSQPRGTLYTGQTNNLVARLRRHNAGSVRATHSGRPFELSYYEEFQSRPEAMWREWELKTKDSTAQKKFLIEQFDKTKLAKVLKSEAVTS